MPQTVVPRRLESCAQAAENTSADVSQKVCLKMFWDYEGAMRGPLQTSYRGN